MEDGAKPPDEAARKPTMAEILAAVSTCQEKVYRFACFALSLSLRPGCVACSSCVSDSLDIPFNLASPPIFPPSHLSCQPLFRCTTCSLKTSAKST